MERGGGWLGPFKIKSHDEYNYHDTLQACRVDGITHLESLSWKKIPKQRYKLMKAYSLMRLMDAQSFDAIIVVSA